MKAIKFGTLALAMAAFVACKQENKAEPTSEEGKEVAQDLNANAQAATPVLEEEVDPAMAPVITFESDTYDLGEVKAKEKVERKIEFTNTGKSPLIIKNAKASCGCTVPKYSEEPVKPGDKGFINVAYTAPAYNGKQSKTVTLTTNSVKKVETLRITANVVGGQEKPKPQPKPQPQPQRELPAPKLEEVN